MSPTPAAVPSRSSTRWSGSASVEDQVGAGATVQRSHVRGLGDQQRHQSRVAVGAPGVVSVMVLGGVAAGDALMG